MSLTPTTGRGSFTITLDRPPPHDATDGVSLGRASFVKEFTGDFVGTSAGEMLSAVPAVTGSAGYVALERLTGALHGRSGSFVVQHVGRLARGASELVITVVPDSGTGELRGLTGQMSIDSVERQHVYSIHYTLPPAEPTP